MPSGVLKTAEDLKGTGRATRFSGRSTQGQAEVPGPHLLGRLFALPSIHVLGIPIFVRNWSWDFTSQFLKNVDGENYADTIFFII